MTQLAFSFPTAAERQYARVRACAHLSSNNSNPTPAGRFTFSLEFLGLFYYPASAIFCCHAGEQKIVLISADCNLELNFISQYQMPVDPVHSNLLSPYIGEPGDQVSLE